MHNALIYIGKLSQKNLYNKMKLKTRWTHTLHCPFLTHISGGKSSAKKYAIFFLLASSTLDFTFFFFPLKLETLLPAGIVAPQLARISEKGLPLGRGSGQKGRLLFPTLFFYIKWPPPLKRKLDKSCSPELFPSKFDPLLSQGFPIF